MKLHNSALMLKNLGKTECTKEQCLIFYHYQKYTHHFYSEYKTTSKCNNLYLMSIVYCVIQKMLHSKLLV